MEEPEIKTVKKVKVRKWYDDEIKLLLKSWKCNYHIKRQVSHKNKSLFYSEIRKDLQQYGYERSVNEIMVKTHLLLKSYRREKKSVLKTGCLGKFPFFFHMIDIEKMELQTESINESELDHSIISDERVEEIIEEGNEEDAQVIEDKRSNDKCVSDSVPLSSFGDNNCDERESDEDVTKDASLSINNPLFGSNDLPATTEDILLGFYKEFRKVHCQLRKNDATLFTLFKEQNEIFKTQTNLLKKLMSQE